MLWVLYGFLHSLFRSLYTEVNHKYKVDSWQLSLVQAFFASVLLTPLLPLMVWPENINFYVGACGVALIFNIGILTQFSLTQQKTGRVASLYIALEAIIGIILWILISPGLLGYHIENPINTVALIIGVLVTVLALIKIRPSDVNLRTLGIVAPIGLSYAVAGIVTKIILPVDNVLPVLLSFVYLNFIIMLAVMGIALLFKRKVDRDLVAKPALIAGGMKGIMGAAATFTFIASVAFAPNPGYTSLMAALLPVWLLLGHLAIKKEDQANPLGAFLVVLGIMIMISASL